MKIAVLGTGLMGAPVALRLADQGFDVSAWNRTGATARARLQDRIPLHSELRDAVSGTDILLLFLSDTRAIETVLYSLPEGLLTGKCLIQMGTIAPRESRDILAWSGAVGAEYLEAPVLGSIPEAKAGRLLLMVGSSDTQFQRFAELFSALGAKPMHIGPVGQGAALKLAMNQLIAGLTASFSLSLGFIQREGVDITQFMAVLRDSALYAPTFDKKLDKMLDGNYANPNFPLKHLDKDVRLFIEAAACHHLQTGMLEGVARIIATGLSRGDADKDYSVLFESVTKS